MTLPPMANAYALGRGPHHSEQDAKLAQNLGQLQPFIVVFPQQCMGQPAQLFWANLTPLPLAARSSHHVQGQRRWVLALRRADRAVAPPLAISDPEPFCSESRNALELLESQLGY
jgi:hypothetical protein